MNIKMEWTKTMLNRKRMTNESARQLPTDLSMGLITCFTILSVSYSSIILKISSRDAYVEVDVKYHLKRQFEMEISGRRLE